VTQDLISVYNLQTKARKDLVKTLSKVRYAKFLKHLGASYLLTVDEALDIIIYDYGRPKISERGEYNSIVYHENLMTSSHIFEEFTVKTEGMSSHNSLLDNPAESKA
jgi:hypothetical protein